MMMVKRGTKWPGFQTGIQGPSVGVLVQWCRNVGHVIFQYTHIPLSWFSQTMQHGERLQIWRSGGSVSH